MASKRSSSPDVRRALYNEYIDLISHGGAFSLAPGYADTLARRFSEMTPQQARAFIEEQRPYVEQYIRERRAEEQRARQAALKKAKFPDLETLEDSYSRADGFYERVVCADVDPQFDKRGMPAYRLDARDSGLRDYRAVHTGSAKQWIPVLMRDGYCDGGRAYIYSIDASLAYKSRQPFYEMEDFHIMDKTASPAGTILFSKREVIPAKMVRLISVVDLAHVRPARDV